MKFDETMLKMTGIGVALGCSLAILAQMGVLSPGHLANRSGDGAGDGGMSSSGAPGAGESWLSSVTSPFRRKVCLKVLADEQNMTTIRLVEGLKTASPEWTVFMRGEKEPCQPNAYVNMVMTNVSLTRGNFGYNTYTTNGVAGSVALYLPSVSKSPSVLSATSDRIDTILENAVRSIRDYISNRGLGGGEENDVPAEDGIMCIAIQADNPAAHNNVGSSISYARSKWYIRDHNNAGNCDPDYYFAYKLISIDGAFGRAGYLTTVVARKAGDANPVPAIGWATDQNGSMNAALNTLLPHVK